MDFTVFANFTWNPDSENNFDSAKNPDPEKNPGSPPSNSNSSNFDFVSNSNSSNSNSANSSFALNLDSAIKNYRCLTTTVESAAVTEFDSKFASIDASIPLVNAVIFSIILIAPAVFPIVFATPLKVAREMVEIEKGGRLCTPPPF